MSHIKEKDWITKAGLRAVVHLVHAGSHRCGYIEIPKGNPLYRKGYSEPCPILDKTWQEVLKGPVGKREIIAFLANYNNEPRPDCIFNVHGGLTFAGGEKGYPEYGSGWWFGFDCAHYGDETRGVYALEEGKWWTLEEVVEECESLAQQIVDATTGIEEVISANQAQS